MKTILWAQNENPNIKNTFIIDGERSDYNDDELQNEAFNKLSEAFKWRKKSQISQGDFKELIKSGGSSSFFYTRNKTGVFIKSCHNQTDDDGRYMPFMFYTETVQPDEILEELKSYSKMVNRTCNESELKEIDKYLKKKGILIFRNIMLFVIWLILILWISWIVK